MISFDRRVLMRWMFGAWGLMTCLIANGCDETTITADAPAPPWDSRAEGATDAPGEESSKQKDHTAEPGPGDLGLKEGAPPDQGIPDGSIPKSWVTAPGGAKKGSNIFISDLAVDKAGNIFITGEFGGTATIGSTQITCPAMPGPWYMFVAKLDPSGKVLWFKQPGCTCSSSGRGVTVDTAGNVYVVGHLCNLAWVTKLDPKGKTLWTTTASQYSRGRDIALDSSGHLHVVGTFSKVGSFGATTIKSSGGTVDKTDLFVAELDAKGKWLGAVAAGGPSTTAWPNGIDHGSSIGLDKAGNRYIAGRLYSATTTFGSKTLSGHKPGTVFVARLEPGNSFAWVVTAATGGDPNNNDHCALAVDKTGHSVITSNLDHPGSFGSFTLTPKGKRDAFVARLDANGKFLWARTLGGMGNDLAWGVTLDSSGNAYVAGHFTDSIILGPKTFVSKVAPQNTPLCEPALCPFWPTFNVIYARKGESERDVRRRAQKAAPKRAPRRNTPPFSG